MRRGKELLHVKNLKVSLIDGENSITIVEGVGLGFAMKSIHRNRVILVR